MASELEVTAWTSDCQSFSTCLICFKDFQFFNFYTSNLTFFDLLSTSLHLNLERAELQREFFVSYKSMRGYFFWEWYYNWSRDAKMTITSSPFSISSQKRDEWTPLASSPTPVVSKTKPKEFVSMITDCE